MIKNIQDAITKRVRQQQIKNKSILQSQASIIQFEGLVSLRTGKWFVLLSLLLIVLLLLTVVMFTVLMMQYRQQAEAFKKNHEVVGSLIPILQQHQHNQVAVPEFKLDALDRLMAVRQLNMQFDRIRLSRQTPLQIEGVAPKPVDVGNLVDIAHYNVLDLEIRQVQAEGKSEGEVKFELRGVQ